MKNIFKTSKRSIAAILTLFIILGIAGTCVYAASVMSEEITTVTEETTAAAEKTLQELRPMMARSCPDTYGTNVWSSIDAALAYYNMPKDSVHDCDVWYNGIHYTCYVQMDSFRIYVRLA